MSRIFKYRYRPITAKRLQDFRIYRAGARAAARMENGAGSAEDAE